MEVTSNLAPYLDTIHSFLNNDAKTQTFTNLTMSIEDALAKIVDDYDFLGYGVDGDCKSISAKVITQLEKNKGLYILSYNFENDEIGKRVMVYKKTPVQAVLMKPETMKPLRRPKCVQASTTTDLSTKTVMSTFKTTCLNATLKFVKNDDQMLLQYPDITTEQCNYIKSMIELCMSPSDNCDTGFKGLYDPLSEALKIFSLKYEFELTDCTPEGAEVKKLKFVKKPKTNRNMKEKDLNTTTETAKKLKQVQPLIQTMSKIDAIFLKDAILKIRDFISNKDSNNLMFTNVSAHEMVFLSHWNTVVNRLEIIQMFDVDLQMALDVIRGSLKQAAGKFKLTVTTEVVQVRNVTFLKVYSKKSMQLPKSARSQPSQSTQDTEKDLHSTQGTEKDLKPSQVIESDPHSNVVIDVPDSDEEFDDLRKLNSNKTFDVKKVPMERSNCVKPKEGKAELSSKSKKSRISRVLDDMEKMGVAWIRCILVRVKQFAETESEAGLVVPFSTPHEKRFLVGCRGWLNRSDSVDTFSEDLRDLVVDLQTFLATKNFSVKGGIRKLRKNENKGREFQFYKEPRYDSLKPPATQIEPNNNENKAQNLQSNVDKPAYIVSRYVPSKVEPKASLKKGENGAVKDVKSLGSAPSKTTRSKKRAPQDLGNGSEWSSATSREVDKRSASSRASGHVVTNMPRAKLKLIEGLNQPLVSEKGLRMMRMMGWEGGALGARGNGIVEPITLQLDLAKRAGLGAPKVHTKQVVVPVSVSLPQKISRVVLPHAPSKAEFVAGVVGIVHKMVASQMATELVLPKPMTNKNWAFVKQLIVQLNQRTCIALESPLNELIEDINQYLKQCDYIFNAIWGTSCKNILFTLSRGVHQMEDLDPKDWRDVVNVELRPSAHKPTDTSPECVLVPGDVFRYYVLSVILDFCRMSNVTIDKELSNKPIVKKIMLKGCMSQKQRSYIKDTVRRANNKSRSLAEGAQELPLYEEVLAAVQGFTLDVDFPLLTVDEERPPVYKCIRLHKIFNTTAASSTHNQNVSKVSGEAARISDESKQTINENISTNKNAVHNVLNIDKAIDVNDQNPQSRVKIVEIQEVNTLVSDNVTSEQSEDTDTAVADCLCCLPDYEDSYNDIPIENTDINKDQANVTKDDQIESYNGENKENDEILDLVNLTLNDEGINTDHDIFLQANEKINNQTEVKGVEEIIEENVIKDLEHRKRIRSKSNLQTPDRAYKKRRIAEFMKLIRIRHRDYPKEEITRKMAGDIQKTILENIDYTQVLPLLKCYGIQDGGLVYSCHSQISLDLIRSVATSLDLDIESDPAKQRHKMLFKMYSYISEQVDQILCRLETFNLTLDTIEWLVTKKEKTSEFIIVHVEVDDISYKFIQNENFILYAGTDAAKFSIVWT